MTKLAGLLGYPLAHSISPAFQQAAFDHYSLPVTYHAWPTHPDSLESAVIKLRGDAYLGANVTVPHKEAVGAYLDVIDSWARSVGAVNTILNERGTLKGYNTDSYGFIVSLKEKGGFDPEGKRALLLGAGGAARAAAFGLAQEGIASLTIANRTIERAQSLAEAVRSTIGAVTVAPMTEAALAEVAANAEVIINSTSIGMSHSDSEGLTPLEGRVIPPTAFVYDMVYNPVETPLLKEAAKAGARRLGGLPMLVYQGAAAFERWTGEKAPLDVMFQAAERALPG